MTYQDFIEHNKKMQNRFEKKLVQLFNIRIEEVRLSENYVRLSNNKVSQIGYLVNAIMQERGCISNPSALKGWLGFSQQKQQLVELTQENIEYIRNLTNQKWRGCQRKEYCIYACQIPEGYVFANLLEQPLSYKAIMKSNNGKPIMSIDKAKKVKGLGEYLKKNGCYITKADRVVLCGTRGELWDVNPEKYQSAYTMTDGNPIREIPKKWTQVKRTAETSAQAVGIQLPIQFLGKYKTSWAVLTVNDLNSEGHGKGDILVHQSWQMDNQIIVI